jgi:predicted Ser/Thr protein kinase
MVTCLSCGSRVSDSGRFCSACGAALISDNLETMEVGPAPSAAQARRQASGSVMRPPSSSGSLLTEGRFLPGLLLAERYRIVALLGRGGMGEVYRADDLTLGQPVALKFLPEEATKDEAMRERFRNEVRIARRVSHPNVCRVYDVGEVDGHTFFTMEYVDGEDLSSLLRRIGRLPSDKALETARQLCAGLAAAHAKGVLHRDLKPANIMLDGRGQVVVTDFGLAGLVEQIAGADVRSGTPAYMSPEQLAGKEVTEKSDIYALGLVLYEIFTGKRAFDIESLPELVPSTLVKDLDPAVERVILRCLESDPTLRPNSVLSIAAALPGGDPLAAALAAGETPSPQMVAAAGEGVGLAPRTAMLCLVAILAGFSLFVYLSLKGSGMGKLGLDQSADVLSQKAREIVAGFGYEGKPVDAASSFFYNPDFLDYVRKNDPHPNWDKILAGRPIPIGFWYRQSPQYMAPDGFQGSLLTPGIVGPSDPPLTTSGMIYLELDARGRLIHFQAIPPQLDEISSQSQQADWKPLFAAAALDPAQVQSVPPLWNSLASSDTRTAWTGKWPGTDWPLRVEAASMKGKPVFFQLIGPWTVPNRMHRDDSKPGQKVSGFVALAVFVSIIVGSTLLARRNYKQGRGDRRGAFRLACVVFVLAVALWACTQHWVPSSDILGALSLAMSTGLFYAGIMWMLYLSLEPYVRRHWPQTLISWNRLLMGQIRDPLVGRDLLFGLILGCFWLLMFQTLGLLVLRTGDAPRLDFSPEYLTGARNALSAWLGGIPNSIQTTLVFFFGLFVLRAVVRREWLAGILFVVIFVTQQGLGSNHLVLSAIALVSVYTIIALVIFRVGVVALATAIFVTNLFSAVPLTVDVSAWYFGNALFPLLSVVALAVWGFYTALAGQKLWKTDAFS